MTTPIEERVARMEGAYEHLATKGDIADLRGELKGDIADFRGELKGDIADLRGELKGDIARAQLSMVRWMVGLGVAHAGIVVAVVIAVAG